NLTCRRAPRHRASIGSPPRAKTRSASGLACPRTPAETMAMIKRSLLAARLTQILCAPLLFLGLTAAVHAQTYPSRPITVISGFGAGSAADSVARILGEHLRETLGQPIVVDNRVGAAGAIGTAYVAR